MPDMNDSKKKILEIIKERGPSLPIHIAKGIGMDMLFASAFLSELVSSNEIKISNLKVGGSPLYYLPGQEEQLDEFSGNLPGKEKEAFDLLKEKKVLKDEEQEPAIRVALRNLRDFANYFWVNKEGDKKLYWYFYKLKENEAREMINQHSHKKVLIKEKKSERERQEPKTKKEKPLLEIKEKKYENKKQTEKSDFVKNIVKMLEEDNVEILEEKEEKKKEYSCIIKVKSNIGNVRFLCVGKDKKRISENDIALLIQKSQAEKMPVFFITPGKMTKKTEEYIKPYSGIIKIRKIS